MQFRDLVRQYQRLAPQMEKAINNILVTADFISGSAVKELEKRLAAYVGVNHCISCGNGTDALVLALMALGIGPGDAVFVPDFTFFASSEAVSCVGATPVCVDVEESSFNMCPAALEIAVQQVVADGQLRVRAVMPVDLFGLPADYTRLSPVAERYGLTVVEDGAQGFGGALNGKKVCGFGKIATTSFFPAKPLGCYGDGGAVFTNDDTLAGTIRSLSVHGKGADKYDNERVGMNSRLDTIQAAVLNVKLDVFDRELLAVNEVAAYYTEQLNDAVKVPEIQAEYFSSWAQYTIRLKNRQQRQALVEKLKQEGIPSMVYYVRPLHRQKVYRGTISAKANCPVTDALCDTVLSLPMHPYLTKKEMAKVVVGVRKNLDGDA